MRQQMLRSRPRSLFLTPLLLWLVAAAPARAEFDVQGTWFVLVHYRDSRTASPDADRWEDLVEFCRQVDRREEARIPLGVATP